jgi:ketosteroid isomerase-like protein
MNTPASIVKRFYGCLQAGDLAGMGALLSENVVLHVPGRHQLAGDYRGPAGVARFAAVSRAVAAGGEHLQVLDVLEGDNFVAALCRVEASRSRHAGLDNRTLHLARVESGRITEIWFHNYDQHAVDAFWGARAS